MYVAISAVIASVSVVLLLSALTLADKSADLLSTMLRLQPLSPADASSALVYSAITFIVAFSGTLFVLRFLGLFLAALGLPNEDSIRHNRELRRMSEAQKRQARLTAHYIMRAQAEAEQQRTEDAKRRTFTDPLAPLPPDPLLSQPLPPLDPKRTTSSQPRTTSQPRNRGM
ncbi:MAG: hypothetical protein IT324_07880 [Anaerolineae bacterium]|nr:hypothetical protein [Anaerolineae bacterium]